MLATKIAKKVFKNFLIDTGMLHLMPTSIRARTLYEECTPCDQVHIEKKDIDVAIQKMAIKFKADRLKKSIQRSKQVYQCWIDGLRICNRASLFFSFVFIFRRAIISLVAIALY